MKTRRPFRGVTDKVEITSRMMLNLAERVVKELKSPLEISKKGRPVIYDRIKLSAAILVKGMRSFVNLSAELSNVRYDTTLDGSERYPSPSELHNIFFADPGGMDGRSTAETRVICRKKSSRSSESIWTPLLLMVRR
jgi:hypothetical protein